MPEMVSSYSYQMNENLNYWKEQIKKPAFIIQYGISFTATYLSTALLTSIEPLAGIAYIHLAFAVSLLIHPLFSVFEPYRNRTLVPLIGSIIHLTVAGLISKFIHALFFESLKMDQIIGLFGILLISHQLAKRIYSNRIIL